MRKIYSKFKLPPRDDVGDVIFTQPSLTEQSFKFECDINNIASGKAFSSLPANFNKPLFDDFTNLGKYQESLNIITKAQSMFEELPSAIRSKFENNPQKLVDFVSKPENYDEGLKLGLFKEKPVETVSKVEIVKGNDLLHKDNLNPANGSSGGENAPDVTQ